MRILRTHGIYAETSIGTVDGEFWSDGLLAIGSRERDAERESVRGPDDLAGALLEIGVPHEEATTLAEDLWSGEMGRFASRFAT